MIHGKFTSGKLLEEGSMRLYYEYLGSPGEGEVLVFIHGHSVDCRMWEPQIKHFNKSFPVLCYDMRGYGRSSLPMEGHDYMHAEDLHFLLQRLDIGAVHLVGLSLGSFVALDYLALYPENVHSVTVASGAIPDSKSSDPVPLVTDVASYKREWYERLLQGCGPDHNGYRSRLWEMICDWTAIQHTQRESESLLGDGLLPRLSNIRTTPAFVVNGAHDFEGAHRSAQKLLDCMPHADCVNLKDAGHFSNMETPEEFNQELQAFLEQLK
ncbi:alpha/beta fold hydrolase [Paenibacillus andongensis]|uniref:alpha/beta fold hydrolase n=1 Tax=Paenibacillus andongensis TaxID=2975482 RepID=UPI0021BBA452|nr:alpha/beta hydrolase [Paenibacillus andongensis]